jgi:hypothetical protein
MSAVEESTAEVPGNTLASPNGGVGKPPDLSYLTDPAEIARIINRTRNLSDEDYEALTLEIGWRVANLVLRAQACSGDVKALDLFLKRCDSFRERRHQRRVQPADPASKPFLRNE